MSYVMTIARRSGSPLTRYEVEHLLANDGEFLVVERNTWRWQPQGAADAADLSWEGNGTLSTGGARSWTSDEALDKLQAIAKRLDASVVGEEGEVLLPEAPPDGGTGPVKCVLGLLLAVLALPFLLLALLVRLPWVIWKLWRSAR